MKSSSVLLRRARLRPPTQLIHAAIRRNCSIASPSLRQSPFLQLLVRNANRRPIRHLLNRRFDSTKPPFNPTSHLRSPEPSLSLSQRLRKLSREYGWSALGVYFLLSALDFPFCFLAVRWLGTDTIGRWESVIVDGFWQLVNLPFGSSSDAPVLEAKAVGAKEQEYGVVVPTASEISVPDYDHSLAEAEQRNTSEDASIWTQLALAYAIHKSFIFIRVPLTAAVLPKVVRVLRGWGWDIGKRRPKGVKGGSKD
ncbi:MAG: hypothetical protein LQ352_002506 [Teloschistes flavicans]|nr:MAG: hypothetical protein LQ352_002506 [Teloschistes flavicans]